MLRKSTGERITRTPGVCGGDACLAGTRIPVWVLAAAHRAGVGPQRIADMYEGVSLADVEAALDYARAFPDEIEDQIAANLD